MRLVSYENGARLINFTITGLFKNFVINRTDILGKNIHKNETNCEIQYTKIKPRHNRR